MQPTKRSTNTAPVNARTIKLDFIANSDEEKILIVKNAVINGWKCFYPLRAYEKKILLERNESQISEEY